MGVGSGGASGGVEQHVQRCNSVACSIVFGGCHQTQCSVRRCRLLHAEVAVVAVPQDGGDQSSEPHVGRWQSTWSGSRSSCAWAAARSSAWVLIPVFLLEHPEDLYGCMAGSPALTLRPGDLHGMVAVIPAQEQLSRVL
ncbi:Hypothetical predicted protein [Marmota monax]|uniref:Uncharacterized protein n=1 Tax=Marmota monax TaxID=9995 RepID=A0A5E4CBK5_MARMO|nr:hypothetical protein GHT09_010366 [Marmota monax]VTJ78232.1 Hypothetical predicted protein [Marmota monax]